MSLIILWLGMMMFLASAIATTSINKRLDRIADALEQSPQGSEVPHD